MEIEEAFKLAERLAEGTNPLTEVEKALITIAGYAMSCEALNSGDTIGYLNGVKFAAKADNRSLE